MAKGYWVARVEVADGEAAWEILQSDAACAGSRVPPQALF